MSFVIPGLNQVFTTDPRPQSYLLKLLDLPFCFLKLFSELGFEPRASDTWGNFSVAEPHLQSNVTVTLEMVFCNVED